LLTVVLAMLLAGTVFRLTNIDGKVCWFDECISLVRISGFGYSHLGSVLDTCSRPLAAAELQSYMHAKAAATRGASHGELMQDYFQHSPLYYFSARAWSEVFGNKSASLRWFSVAISLVGLGLLYLLALELFGCHRAACLALCLGASSPAFLIYAQQIRHYSIWVVTVLLASLTLLRAVRRGGPQEWVCYSASLALSFLANPLSLAMAAGHGIFVFLQSKSALSTRFKPFTGSVIAALLILAAPRIYFSSFDVITGQGFDWLRNFDSGPGDYLWATAVQPWSRLFWDSVSPEGNIGHTLLASALACLVISAMYYLNRYAPREQALFINTVVLPSIGILIARDLVLDGRSATITRYIFPSLIGVELAVAYLFACKTSASSVSRGARVIWAVLFASLVLVGIQACATLSAAALTWAAPESTGHVVKEADVLNRQGSPVILIPCDNRAALPLVLADRLRPDARIIPLRTKNADWRKMVLHELSLGNRPFLWNPAQARVDSLTTELNLTLRTADSAGRLWILSHK
jgi:uncharacterized membrane protein